VLTVGGPALADSVFITNAQLLHIEKEPATLQLRNEQAELRTNYDGLSHLKGCFTKWVIGDVKPYIFII